jgi:hypothetical protein
MYNVRSKDAQIVVEQIQESKPEGEKAGSFSSTLTSVAIGGIERGRMGVFAEQLMVCLCFFGPPAWNQFQLVSGEWTILCC